jgi:hypothetical protein
MGMKDRVRAVPGAMACNEIIQIMLNAILLMFYCPCILSLKCGKCSVPG